MLNGFTNAHEYVRKLFHNNIQNVTNLSGFLFFVVLVISFALLMLYVNSYHTILYTMILKGRTFYRNTIYVDSTKVFDIRDMIVLYISVVHLFGWRKLCVLQKSSHHRILSQKVFCLNAKHTSSRKSPNWAYNKLNT